MSDTDTETIDNKKNTSTINSKKIIRFVISFFVLLLLTILYFSFGAITLYFCKLAQSNILPTERNCFPYTSWKPKIAEIPINIFTTLTSPPLSIKIKFPYDDYNSSNKLLDLFRDYKQDPNSSFMTNYFLSIFESLLQGNYSFFNVTYNAMNGLPEYFILLFGPIIGMISTGLLLLWNYIYVIYLWFANMSWFFKKNVQEQASGKPKWQTISPLSVIPFACAVGLVILFCILFWFIFIPLPIFTFITVFICFITMLNYNAIMKIQDIEKSISILTIIKDVFKFYKSIIMGLFSFFLILSAFSNFGSMIGLVGMVVIGFFYFGFVATDLYMNMKEDGLTAIVSNKQALKTCIWNDPFEKKHGLLYYIFSGGAKNLTRDLKMLHKK